jgi:glucose/arabinose dehydrogenase
MKKLLCIVAVMGIFLAGCTNCTWDQLAASSPFAVAPKKAPAETAALQEQKAEAGQESGAVTAESAEAAALQEQKAAAEKLKESLTNGEAVSISDNQSVVAALGSPYAKYRLETGEMEIWFYDNFYLVFDRNIVSLKDYEVTIPAVN